MYINGILYEVNNIIQNPLHGNEQSLNAKYTGKEANTCSFYKVQLKIEIRETHCFRYCSFIQQTRDKLMNSSLK